MPFMPYGDEETTLEEFARAARAMDEYFRRQRSEEQIRKAQTKHERREEKWTTST